MYVVCMFDVLFEFVVCSFMFIWISKDEAQGSSQVATLFAAFE